MVSLMIWDAIAPIMMSYNDMCMCVCACVYVCILHWNDQTPMGIRMPNDHCRSLTYSSSPQTGRICSFYMSNSTIKFVLCWARPSWMYSSIEFNEFSSAITYFTVSYYISYADIQFLVEFFNRAFSIIIWYTYILIKIWDFWYIISIRYRHN